MSTFDYTGIKNNTVIPNLTKFGAVLTMTRYETTELWTKEYDIITSRDYWKRISDDFIQYTDPGETPTTYASVGLLTKFETSDIDDTLIKQGDMKLLTVDIPKGKAGDVYTIGGASWSYVNEIDVDPTNAVTVLQKIQVRK